jgi:hypothetical protein
MGYLNALTLQGRTDATYRSTGLAGLSGTYSPTALGLIGVGIFGALAFWLVTR